MAFKQKENLSKFGTAIRTAFNMSPRDIFAPNDLHESKNLPKVRARGVVRCGVLATTTDYDDNDGTP